jgi:hypothetical protein
LPDKDAGPTIAVLPGGSAPRWRYPSLASWRHILEAFTQKWPTARFCLVGKLADDGRTSTTFTRAEFEELAKAVPEATWAVDVPLAEQLAAVARCDLLLSPHTGFAFAASPATSYWATPPDPTEDDGPRSPSMSAARINEDLAELIEGAEWLLSGAADYDTAMRNHIARVRTLFEGRTNLIFSVDNLHVPYL